MTKIRRLATIVAATAGPLIFIVVETAGRQGAPLLVDRKPLKGVLRPAAQRHRPVKEYVMHVPRSTIGVGALVVIIDQVTKSLAALPWVRDEVPLVEPVANHALTLQIANAGRWTEVLLMAVVFVGAAALVTRLCRRGAVGAVEVGLILGGALGNIIDRTVVGFVRDFLAVGPVVVNLADIAVLLGLVSLYVRLARNGESSRRLTVGLGTLPGARRGRFI